MRIIVPSLKIFQANFFHEMKLNNKAKFELGRLANLTKQDKAAFASLAHSMVDDWQDYRSGIFETNFSLFSWKSWCIIVIGIFAVLGFGLSVLLSYKLRVLAATLTAVSLAGRAHALPTELNFFPPTPRPMNTTNIFRFDLPTDLTLDVTVILLLVIIVLVILVKGFKRHQLSQFQFDLYLHVGINTEAVQIWIKTFKLEPTCYTFQASNFIESLDVIGCLWPRLLITWPSLQIKSQVTNEVYSLPKMVNLTYKQAMFLRRLLQGSYWCVLVTKTKCEQALLPLPGRNSVPAYGAIPHVLSMVTLKTNASAPELYPNLETESRLYRPISFNNSFVLALI